MHSDSPPSDFQHRANQALRSGRLTIADLSTWFARPYATVRSWVLDGRRPWGPHGDEAIKWLGILEQAIAREQRFPMPLNLSPLQRREYIRQSRAYWDRVSSPRAAP